MQINMPEKGCAAAPLRTSIIATPPPPPPPPCLRYGKFDGQLWDIAAKKEIFNDWDPEKPRSELNFNPFERDENGNAADASVSEGG